MLDGHTRRNFTLFAAGVFCLSLTFGIHFSVFNNFAVERIGIQPHHLGIMESIREVPGLLGVLIGGLIVRFSDARMAGFSLLLFGAGFLGYAHVSTVPVLILCSFIWSLGFHIGLDTPERFVLKRKYSLFYGLHILDGCRRQIFGTFAVFTLVRVYHIEVERIALLALANSALSFLFGPQVGRFIDRFGERTALTINYVEMGLVFLGFATVHAAGVLCALYVLDSFFFLLSMSLNTYISKITDPGDLRPTLAMSVTMNHVAAVATPLIGGYLWVAAGYETIFAMGVLLSAVALGLVQRLRIHRAPNRLASSEPA